MTCYYSTLRFLSVLGGSVKVSFFSYHYIYIVDIKAPFLV